MYSSDLSIEELNLRLNEMRGDKHKPPNASIVIPVNAEEDLLRVFQVVGDILLYEGNHKFEVVLVINNFPADNPPWEINKYRDYGFSIVDIPDARKQNEGVILSARMYGLKYVLSNFAIFFDVDCFIPNPTHLLDWYIQQLENGVMLAHTRVDYYNLNQGVSVRLRMFIHNLTRWVKRLIGIPPNQGCNYAVNRPLILELYNKGLFVRDMFVGPAVKSVGGKIAYSGSKELRVITSGRKINAGWQRLFRYLLYRIQFNLKLFPIRFGKLEKSQQ